jgi:hypothetical protein
MIFLSLIDAGNQALFYELIAEKRLALDVVDDQIDRFVQRDLDWEPEYAFYRDSVAFSMEILDAVDMTFAAAYDCQLNTLSDRTLSYNQAAFDPTRYPEFVDAVGENERGHLTLWFEAEGVQGRDMYLYYRWVPTDETLEGRFLTVIAISSFSVRASVSDRIGYSVIVLILVTTVLNLALVAALGSHARVRKKEGGG